MEASEIDGLPAFVQGSTEPLFKGAGDEDFLCECGQVLVEGFLARQFIAVGFICYRCKALSKTNVWPKAEPIPKQTICLEAFGKFLLLGTIDVTGSGGFISEQEAARVNLETGARPRRSTPLVLTEEWLDYFQALLNSSSAGAMNKSVDSTMRAKKSKNTNYFRSPPAWAICHLRGCIERCELYLKSPEDCAAIAYIQILQHLTARWQHHPLFLLLSKGMVLEYPHTVTQLTVASYLADHGNDIGFTDMSDVEGRSPDLYINLNFFAKVSIEVKAPSELQWPNPCPSSARLEKIILKSVQKAIGQLTGELGGIVVIGTSWAFRGAEKVFKDVIIDLIKRGKISSKVSGVAGVCMFLAEGDFRVMPGSVNTGFSSDVFVFLNDRFKGVPYLKI